MTDRGGIVVEQDLMVPARDGVVLATDVYRPAGPGPFPVLLEQ
jgi:predicted acyl esterase